MCLRQTQSSLKAKFNRLIRFKELVQNAIQKFFLLKLIKGNPLHENFKVYHVKLR